MADLFTAEFFHNSRQQLAPGGLFATWIQAYALQTRDVQTIVATFKSAFPHVATWELMPGGDYLLIGSDAPLAPDPEDFAARLDYPGLTAAKAKSGSGDALDLHS